MSKHYANVSDRQGKFDVFSMNNNYCFQNALKNIWQSGKNELKQFFIRNFSTGKVIAGKAIDQMVLIGVNKRGGW